MSNDTGEMAARLHRLLIERIPEPLSPLDLRAIGSLAGQLCARIPVCDTDDLRLCAALVKIGWFAGNHVAAPKPADGKPDPTGIVQRAELAAAVDRSWAGELLHVPMPPNPYLVTNYGSLIQFHMDGPHKLLPQNALQLAVWLIALADPTLSAAALMLAKVATR